MDPILPILFYAVLESLPREENKKYISCYYDLEVPYYDDYEFLENFRICRNCIAVVLQAIKPFWKRKIDLHRSLLCFMWHVATGDSYRSLSSRFGIRSSSVYNVTNDIATLVGKHLHHYVTYNLSNEDVNLQKYKFGRKFNLHDCIAAIDGVFIHSIDRVYTVKLIGVVIKRPTG
jgi:hypothetical protein